MKRTRIKLLEEGLFYSFLLMSHPAICSPKKMKKVLEIVKYIFLLSQVDEKYPIRLTSEANEHTFEGWRGIVIFKLGPGNWN